MLKGIFAHYRGMLSDMIAIPRADFYPDCDRDLSEHMTLWRERAAAFDAIPRDYSYRRPARDRSFDEDGFMVIEIGPDPFLDVGDRLRHDIAVAAGANAMSQSSDAPWRQHDHVRGRSTRFTVSKPGL